MPTPRLTGDQHHPRPAVGRPPQSGVQPAQLLAPPDEHRTRHRRRGRLDCSHRPLLPAAHPAGPAEEQPQTPVRPRRPGTFRHKEATGGN
ncbi:MAG TPA: hypothetical protein VKP11_00730 [Frankiaceae bacterium]|nr:hypothetical protein [Frankiaceae bacterium]